MRHAKHELITPHRIASLTRELSVGEPLLLHLRNWIWLESTAITTNMRRSYRGSAAVGRGAGGYNHRLRRISPSIDQFGKDPLEISGHNTIDMSSSATCSTAASTTTASQRSLDVNAFSSTVSISEDQAPSIPASFDEVLVDTTPRTSNTYTKTTPKKSVSFHQVSIREYPRTIGDNPEVGLGCPIGLSWEYHELATEEIDAYESSRGQRKSSTQMRLHPTTRHRMMLAAGASKEEIKTATKEAAKVQRRRVCTANLDFLPLWTRTELLLQSLKRKLKRRSWRSRS